MNRRSFAAAVTGLFSFLLIEPLPAHAVAKVEISRYWCGPCHMKTVEYANGSKEAFLAQEGKPWDIVACSDGSPACEAGMFPGMPP